ILILLVFVAAVMGNVAGSLFADPARMMGLAALAFAVFFLLVGVTALIFRGIGRERALALGLMVSHRNMGLTVAATDRIPPGAIRGAAQIIGQRRIVDASCRNDPADAERNERKGAIAFLGLVQIGLKDIDKLLQHLAIGLFHSVAAACDIRR